MNGKRILVVDDEENLRRVTQLKLQQAGFEAATASDGAEALNILSRNPQDLLITDLKMPGMDGLELLQHIRRTNPALPVVVLSAFGTVPMAVEAIKAGANDFLVKPFSQDALDRVLDRSAATQTQSAPETTDLITQNGAMRTLLHQAAQAARTQATRSLGWWRRLPEDRDDEQECALRSWIRSGCCPRTGARGTRGPRRRLAVTVRARGYQGAAEFAT